MSSILPAIFSGIMFVGALWRLPIPHPIQLWAGSWASATVLYALRLLPYRDLGWLTAALICGAVVAFAIGVPLGSRLAARRPRAAAPERSGSIELAAALAIGLLVLTLGAFLARLVARFGFVKVFRISTEVKVYLSSGEAPFFTTYVELAVAATALCAFASTRVVSARARTGWLVAAAACAATVYFSTSRGFIAVALAAGLATLAMARQRAQRRWLAGLTVAAVLATVALFIGLGAVIGKTYGNSPIGRFDNFFSRHPAVSSLALPYEDITASIPALDLLVHYSPTFGVAHGCATVPIACGVVRKLGVSAPLVPVAGPFTRGPLSWNAYTFLDRFLIDVGPAATLLLVALVGVLAGYLWTRARAGSTLGILMYAIAVPGLVGAYRQNLIELLALAGIVVVIMLAVGRLLARIQPLSARIVQSLG